MARTYQPQIGGLAAKAAQASQPQIGGLAAKAAQAYQPQLGTLAAKLAAQSYRLPAGLTYGERTVERRVEPTPAVSPPSSGSRRRISAPRPTPSLDLTVFRVQADYSQRQLATAVEMRGLLEEMVARDRDSAEREARSEARAEAAEKGAFRGAQDRPPEPLGCDPLRDPFGGRGRPHDRPLGRGARPDAALGR